MLEQDLEKRPGGRKLQPRVDGPTVQLGPAAQITAGGSATVVAHAVDIHPVAQAGRAGKRQQLLCPMRADGVVVPVGFTVHEHPAAIGSLEPENRRRRLLTRPAQVIAFNPTPADDRRNRVGMAKGVRLPLDEQRFRPQAEMLSGELASVEQVTGQAFAIGQILVRLHPRRRRHFPAPFGHALPDLLEQLRAVPADNVVNHPRALRQAEIRELFHQLQHGGEGVMADRHRLRPGPHPVHVDVGMADTMHGVGLGDFANGRQMLLDPARGGLQRGWIAGPGARLILPAGRGNQGLPLLCPIWMQITQFLGKTELFHNPLAH